MKLSDCGAMMSRCAESSVLVPVSGVPESAVAGSAVAESVVGSAVLNSVVSVVPVIVAPSAGDPEGIESVDAVSVVDVADSVKTSFSGLVAGVMWVSAGRRGAAGLGDGCRSAGVVSAGVIGGVNWRSVISPLTLPPALRSPATTGAASPASRRLKSPATARPALRSLRTLLSCPFLDESRASTYLSSAVFIFIGMGSAITISTASLNELLIKRYSWIFN